MPNCNTPKEYRKALGFTNQQVLKTYCKATDIVSVNWTLIEQYNSRLIELFAKINAVIMDEYKMAPQEFDGFKLQVEDAYSILKGNSIINSFTNNGRPREGVYYNWMRGYMVSLFFKKVIAKIFDVAEAEVEQLGKDNLQIVKETGESGNFKRDALADLKIESKKIHIEVQAGFTGKNDIKRSKANDANQRKADGWDTYVLHFDLFNGKLAVIDITNLNSLAEKQWIENAQFEGVFTVTIPEDAFKWNITTKLPLFAELSYTIE